MADQLIETEEQRKKRLIEMVLSGEGEEVQPTGAVAPSPAVAMPEGSSLSAFEQFVESLDREGAAAAAPAPEEASTLEILASLGKGVKTGAKESLLSGFGLGPLAQMAGDVPQNIGNIVDFLRVATPEQRAEWLRTSGKEFYEALNPYKTYFEEKDKASAADQIALEEKVRKEFPNYDELPEFQKFAVRDYVKKKEGAPALSLDFGEGVSMLGELIPETPKEAELLGESMGAQVTPVAALGTAKKTAGVTGKALKAASKTEVGDALLNVFQNKAIELSRLASGSGTVANTLRVLKRTIDRERQMWSDADRFQKKFVQEYDNILGGVDTSPANKTNLIRDILGDKDRPGAFRTYIDRNKAQKDRLLQTAQEKIKAQEIAKTKNFLDTQVELGDLTPEEATARLDDLRLQPAETFGELAPEDFNLNKLRERQEYYAGSRREFSQAQAEAFKEAEKGLLKSISETKSVTTPAPYEPTQGRPRVPAETTVEVSPPKIKTLANIRDEIRRIDQELEAIGFFDDKTWAIMNQDPSIAAKVAAESAALKATRDVLLDAQKNKLQRLLGPKAMKNLEDLNENIAMGIEYQNIFARALPMTQENLAKVSGSSLNRYVQDQGIARGIIKSGEEALFPGGEVRASLAEQMQLVDELRTMSEMVTGKIPMPTDRTIGAYNLGQFLERRGAPMTPAQLATTAGLGYTSAVAPENFPPAQEIPASLIELLSQQQPQPPMTPATPGAMAPASLLQTLAQPEAEAEGMGDSLVPGADAASEMQQVQGADFIQQMSGQPGPGLAGPEMPQAPQAPEAPPMEPIQGMLGGLPPMGGAGQMAEGPSLMAAQQKPFKPIKPTLDNVIDNAGAIAREITSLLGPEEANNVLQQLQEAIQSKNDMAVGKVVTAFTKAYPEAQNIFEDEFPDMPIFTFNGKIYQPDDRQAYEKWLTQTNASSIEKAKSLSALNTDGTVRLPKGR
jgi:polyhydroxyalkanoate synthesis regulator phasin